MGGGEGSRLTLVLPLCLQTETPWAPSPRCPPATTTHPRTAISPDTMTCLQFGTLRHPHFGTRTAEGPGWCAEAGTPEFGTELAAPCQEQGEDWQAVDMNVTTSNEGSKWRGRSPWLHAETLAAGSPCPFLRPPVPQAPRARAHDRSC